MKSKNFILVPLAILMLVVVGFLVKGIVYQCLTEELTVTVTGRDRITEASGKTIKSRYVVFTKGETFENTDTWLRGKFDSSDLQGQLVPYQTYKIKVVGYRIPLFSTYRNIVSVVPSEETTLNTRLPSAATATATVPGDTIINGKHYQRSL